MCYDVDDILFSCYKEPAALFTNDDLMNINPEAYKYTRSSAPSRSKWRLIDIIPINYIIYTHNFYTIGKLRISAFQLHAACKDPSS